MEEKTTSISAENVSLVDLQEEKDSSGYDKERKVESSDQIVKSLTSKLFCLFFRCKIK